VERRSRCSNANAAPPPPKVRPLAAERSLCVVGMRTERGEAIKVCVNGLGYTGSSELVVVVLLLVVLAYYYYYYYYYY
jgi:hypothetical protein